MQSNILFITGTDTGVGKTIATAILALAFQKLGLQIKVMKPIMSGGSEDRDFLCQILSLNDEPKQISPYVFTHSLSPHLAARLENQKINISTILKQASHLSRQTDLLLIEGIGGILVPITENQTTLDLLLELQAAPLIVCANKIGVINHSLLTTHALRTAGSMPVGFLLNNLPEIHEESCSTNKQEIETLANLNCWGEIPVIKKDRDSLLQASELLDLKKLESFFHAIPAIAG